MVPTLGLHCSCSLVRRGLERCHFTPQRAQAGIKPPSSNPPHHKPPEHRMDVSCQFFNYFPQSSWSCPSSDSEFYNLSSPETVSPSSYMDFSPSQLQNASSPTLGPHIPDSLGCQSRNGGQSRIGTRRMRCKNPSKQRQSASEKEKLRMRDLTKALHHLRTYLPPSVAPAGQTLTKIETLRLTIRYISYLSAQLGLSEESLCQMRDRRVSGYQETSQKQFYPTPEYLGMNTPHPELCPNRYTASDSALRKTEMDCRQVYMGTEISAYEDSFNSSSESLLGSPMYADTPTTYQGYNKTVHCPITPEFWG